MKTELDIIIRNSGELEDYVDENQDLRYPDNDIRLEFQPNESEIRDIECKSLFLCVFKNGAVDERFDFAGRDIMCWGDCILRDFYGRHFMGGSFVGRDFDGVNAFMWTFEGRKVIYYAAFVAYNLLRCSSIFGKLDNSLHECLNEKIEFIDEEDFKYGVYSLF
ncbi:MAG: hypothetical protein PHC85_02955 [Candidatus Pacebacteria bacterium]|nr:hypothetical protein [Candidatus Paceibacterota bacterium]